MDLSKLPRLSKTEPGDVPEPVGGPAPATTAAPAPAPSSFCTACGAPLRPGARFCDSCGAPSGATAGTLNYAAPPEPGMGPEAWVSIVLGLLLVLMQPRIWQYLFMRQSFTWEFSDPQGNPLAYPKTVFFWGDVALAAFALTLIMEGVVIGFARRPALVAAALGLTVVATLVNLIYVVAMIVTGYGLQMFSGLAVAFGGYIAFYEWRMLQALRARAARQE